MGGGNREVPKCPTNAHELSCLVPILFPSSPACRNGRMVGGSSAQVGITTSNLMETPAQIHHQVGKVSSHNAQECLLSERGR